VRELRGGKDDDADFSLRMKGEGVWAQLIAQRVRKAAARHGLGRRAPALAKPARVAKPAKVSRKLFWPTRAVWTPPSS
jgi:hypothetical protein